MIFEKIKRFLEKQINFKHDKSVTWDKSESLIEKGLIDSLTMIHLISFVEETFNIDIQMEDFLKEDLSVLDNLERCIRLKLNGDKK